VIVNCSVYESGVRREAPLALEDAFEVGREPDAFVWIALHAPTAEEFDAVNKELSLHPLAVEDALHAHQRPKLEIYDDTLFVVAKTATYDDRREVIDLDEIHLFLGDGFIVTIHHGPGTGNGLAHLAHEAEHKTEIAKFGPGGILYAVLDHTVDAYQEVIDGIETDIDQLESQVFADARSNSAERIFRLKRQVLAFQRALLPLEEVVERLARQQVPPALHQGALSDYFRDVHDHVMQVAGRIETARDTLGSALEANLAQVSVRQNDDMRAMSGWAAVIGVPTLFAGVWGMNFEKMPELHSRFGYPVALATIVGSGLMVRWKLKRNGWM
jgi:magnesium transporter